MFSSNVGRCSSDVGLSRYGGYDGHGEHDDSDDFHILICSSGLGPWHNNGTLEHLDRDCQKFNKNLFKNLMIKKRKLTWGTGTDWGTSTDWGTGTNWGTTTDWGT